MQIDWQTIVALAIVLLAVASVVRGLVAWVSGKSESGCSVCPVRDPSDAIKSLPLVQIKPAEKAVSAEEPAKTGEDTESCK